MLIVRRLSCRAVSVSSTTDVWHGHLGHLGRDAHGLEARATAPAAPDT